MPIESFYVGPRTPHLRATSWDDVTSAAQSGALTETQWVELKEAVPAAAPGANLELARDLASLTVDGGLLLIGVKDPGDKAEHVVGTSDDIESLKGRIDQISSSTRVQPPMRVVFGPHFKNPGDETRSALIVVVPPSPLAPHMVDGRYWGRSATGKRPLTDLEVTSLLERRRARADDFRSSLIELSSRLDPVAVQDRAESRMYVLVAPVVPPNDPSVLASAVGRNLLELIREARPFDTSLSPTLKSLRYADPHPDGYYAISDRLEDRDESWLLCALLDVELGEFKIATSVSRAHRDGESLILAARAAQVLHQASQVAIYIGQVLGYPGLWNVGVHFEGLRGRKPSQAYREAIARCFPFPHDSHTRTALASASDLANRPSEVVQKLLTDFMRALGLANHYFPYDDPRTLEQRM